MKIYVGFILLLFSIGCAPASNQNIQTKTPLPLPSVAGSTPPDVKREMRRKAVEQSKIDNEKSGSTAELQGPNEDVLLFTSSRLSEFEILQQFKDSFEEFRNLGFTKLIFIDKDKKRREVDLTVLEK
jgi:hypothetical protein